MVKVVSVRKFSGAFKRDEFFMALSDDFRGGDILRSGNKFQSKWTNALCRRFEDKIYKDEGVGKKYRDWTGDVKQIFLIINRLPICPDIAWLIKQSVLSRYMWSEVQPVATRIPKLELTYFSKDEEQNAISTTLSEVADYTKEEMIEEDYQYIDDFLKWDIQSGGMLIYTRPCWGDVFRTKPHMIYDCDLGKRVKCPRRTKHIYKHFECEVLVCEDPFIKINIKRIPHTLWDILITRASNKLHRAGWSSDNVSWDKQIEKLQEGDECNNGCHNIAKVIFYDLSIPDTQDTLCRCGLKTDIARDIAKENYVWFIENDITDATRIYKHNNITYEFETPHPYTKQNKFYIEYHQDNMLIHQIY
jgi:hypothetical protein